MYAMHDTAAVPAWNPQQLADAVPLRLHQLIGFDLAGDAAAARSANAEPRRPLRTAHYAAAAALPLFAVR